MKFIKTPIAGLLLIENFHSKDNRGVFSKTFNEDIFIENGIDFEIKESYFSTNKKDVIRGMHFQNPPSQHKKIVSLLSGKITDVILDLRKKSKTYKNFYSFDLASNNFNSIFIPEGCAHGFLSHSDNTTMIYYLSSVYDPKNDYGIRYDSFGFEWNVKKPIISERDKKFAELKNFVTPF